jgi:hypothetical protein
MLPYVQNDYSHIGGPFRHELNELQFLKVWACELEGIDGLVSLGIGTSSGNAKGSRRTQ